MTIKEEDETATESDDSQFSYLNEHIVKMPPLKYARIVGCLPRSSEGADSAADSAAGGSAKVDHGNRGSYPIDTEITSSTMGRIILRPEPLSSVDYAPDEDEIDHCTQSYHNVLALGFIDGSIRVVDANTGESVLFGSSLEDGGVWFVNLKGQQQQQQSGGRRIVSLSFDSSCSHLAAVDVNGDAVVFGPLIWGRRSQRVGLIVEEGKSKMSFLSFGGATKPVESVSATVGTATAAASSNRNKGVASDNVRVLPPFAMIKPPMGTIRFSYTETQALSTFRLSHSDPNQLVQHPTCMVIDPSYARNKKERSLLLGFQDGRLVLSKIQVSSAVTSGIGSRLFGSATSSSSSSVKKIDTVLYQGVMDGKGIEAVAWRGGMIAWADESGVRIFDIETMSRIAHVDRPTGARSNLYPTVSSLQPCLLFERSDSLLIGWGDCLMSMQIRDSTSPSKQSKEGGSAGTKDAKRKIVTCGMAWELDCVACGVMPVDARHVAVLGLVPSLSEDDDYDDSRGTDNDGNRNCFIAGDNNTLELQIINRGDGKSISNDRIPLLEKLNCSTLRTSTDGKPHVTDFSLLSSFGIQRMEDLAEWDALDDGEKETIRNEVDMSEFMSKQTFPDAHLRWSIEKDVCTIQLSPNDTDVLQTEASEDDDDQSSSSNCSVLSDDYVFALSEPLQDILPDPTVPSRSQPPTMVILYKHDACLVQTRDADDAVSYARSLGKPALALKVALAHRRDVRRHAIDLLIDEYFLALLRLQSSSSDAALSFSRLQIAAQSLPILLGGDARMWQRWIFIFARVSGGLFTIRDKIPVRDPWLSPFVFEMALEKMLNETCSKAVKQIQTEGISSKWDIGDTMADLFLETLRAWGPTSSLRRRTQMHRYFIQSHHLALNWRSLSGSQTMPFIQQAEKDLQRRISQTAFGVLTDVQSPNSESKLVSPRQHISSSDDSLFNVENMIMRLTKKLFVGVDESSMNYDLTSSSVLLGSFDQGAATTVEALAELELMRDRYDRAIGYYLAIGSRFIGESSPSSVETCAVEAVNKFHRSEGASISNTVPRDRAVQPKYEHVLSLIELYQLHHFLLRRNYFFIDQRDESDVCPPIVSLIKLVGLELAGSFLMDSCSPPDDVSRLSAENASEEACSGLPLDLVSDQLKSTPRLLYWYLFLLFVQKPELYVKFATTAVPPVVITELHRTQFSLFLDYADNEAKTVTAPSFLDVDEETLFMSFLKAALPHGGIRPESVIDMLETCRGGRIDSPVFARELAFVIEKFGSGTDDDARKVMQLYIHGAKNLFLAVAYAERASKQSNILWEMLISHCTKVEGDGALFGSLLEAAAHCGADLASLVSKIPEGVSIEGLRPKLIAAVTDYRYKVKIHEFESNILSEDKMSIIRELGHLSRRGSRITSVGDASYLTLPKNTIKSRSSLQLQRDKKSDPSFLSHLSNAPFLAIR